MIYSNAGIPLTGKGTSGSCTYTPTSGDSRVLRVSWNDGVHPSNPLPPQTLGTVPSAITADSLDGLTASQFIQSDSTVTQSHLDTLTNGSDASALHNHDSLYLRVNNSSSFNAGSGTFYTSGKIGIGTSTPLNALDIVGTPSVDGSDQALIGTFDSRPLNAGTGGGIEFGGVYDGSGDRTDWASLKGIKENSTSGDTSAALVFSTAGATGPGSATEKMRISSAGNVGIGATLPSSALDLNGAFTIEGIAAPSVSPAGQGRMYYDSTSNTLKLSINGGAYSPVVTGTSGSYVSKTGDTMTGALNINSGAITTSAPALNTTQTWNNGATTFTGVLENVTNTASNPASKLVDLQVGGVSKFNVDVSGNTTSTAYYGDGSHLTGLVTAVNWPVPGTIGSTTPNTGAFTTLNASSLSTTGNITDNGTLLMPTAPTASAVASSIDLGAAIAGGNANGTYVGINAANGYSGDLANLEVNGVSKFKVDASGNVNATGTFTGNGSGLTNVTAGALNLGNQTANTVYAGPASAPMAVAGFRALVPADIPFTAPGPIGATTASTGAFTTLNSSSLGTIGNIADGGTLSVTGASTLTGNTTVGGTLAVTGASTLTGNLKENGSITQAGIAAPAVSSAGQGIIYFDSGSNTFEISQNGGAYSPIATMASSGAYLPLTGGTLSGPMSGTSISTSGNITDGGTLGVTGATTLSTLSTSGNIADGGTLGVTGATTLSSLSTSGNTSVGGTLGVTGASTFTGNVGIGTTSPSTALQVNGTTTTTAAKVTGNLQTTQVTETAVNLGSSLSGTVTLNLASGTYFYGTLTGSTTFAVSNAAAAGLVSSFTLELTNGGSQAVSWMSGTKWPSGTVPTLTSSGTDILVCSTRDGATTWRCVAAEMNSQ
jgi:hypothetical protein